MAVKRTVHVPVAPSVIEVSRSGLLRNLRFFQKLTTRTRSRVYPVVKANAYGHGLPVVVEALKGAADGFCVHSAEEALGVVAVSPKPVLVMGHVPPNATVVEEILRRGDPRFVVFEDRAVETLGRAGKAAGRPVPVYVKLETGTNRLGLKKEAAARLVKKIRRNGSLQLRGFSTHFANIEDTTDHTYADEQYERFVRMAAQIADGSPYELHSACSAAALLFPKTHQTFVRLGISLYGYWPSRETYVSYKLSEHFTRTSIEPVLTWKTKPVQVKQLEEGEYVGYGLTYQTRSRMRIAVLPIGYSDGYDRRLSNSGYVLIRGKRAPLCGRVCMNLVMVDVTHIKGVTVDDDVILLGKSGAEILNADRLATLMGSISYEVLARLSPAIPRALVE